MLKPIYLGVNIDHVATLRQARGERYPDPVQAAFIAVSAGADGITIHLREDRRHIQERDVRLLKETLTVPMNLEMATDADVVTFAKTIRPEKCCLVPEKRAELTTEGGLDVIAQEKHLATVCKQLAECGIEVSLFIDPDAEQIKAAKRTGAPVIELHTGEYANARQPVNVKAELHRLQQAARLASDLGLIVNAGHGLHYQNVQSVAAIPELHELNIGHSIVAQAVMIGLETAVRDMKQLMTMSRATIAMPTTKVNKVKEVELSR